MENLSSVKLDDLKSYGEGEITSRSITAVIEPYGKHFIEQIILPTTTSTTTFLVLIGNTWNDIGKSKKGEVCIKKDPYC